MEGLFAIGIFVIVWIRWPARTETGHFVLIWLGIVALNGLSLAVGNLLWSPPARAIFLETADDYAIAGDPVNTR